MLRKWFVSALAVTAMAMLFPVDAHAQLGKGGDDKGGGKQGGGKAEPTKGGGKTEPAKGGGKGEPSKGGGGQTQPPSRGGGGGQTQPPSKGGGGGQTQPPSRGGGGQTQPPSRGGGGQTQPPSRGGGSGGGKIEPPKGGGKTQPPVRGGGQTQPPVRGGGQTQPPVRGGGQTQPPVRGGGQTQPPVRGGGQTQPPVRGGGKVEPPKGSSAQLGKGGGQTNPPTKGNGGQTQPPTKGGGGQTQPPVRGGGQTQPPTKGGGQTQPPVRGGGGQTQPPVRGGGGQTQPPVRGGGTSGLGKGGGNGQTQPPVRGGGNGQTQPPVRGGGNGGGRIDNPTVKGGGSNGAQSTVRGNQPPQRGRGENGTQFERQGVFQKTQNSRTGQSNYGTTRNQIGANRSTLRITDAPNIHGWNSKDRDVFRENRTVVHDNRYRQGYCHYSNNWRDDWFYYPNYYFDYRPGHCFPSPFYYYPHVPGYIASIRVVLGDFRFYITARERYQYQRPYNYGGYQYSYNKRDLIDYQIDNLVNAFEYGQISYANNMLPRNGYVHVALEEESDYRMYSDDFYDMLADIVEGTDTRSYRIQDVRYDRNQYVVYAEHEFVDPWGNIDRKYHTIVFQRDREGYEIAYFKVDRYPNW